MTSSLTGLLAEVYDDPADRGGPLAGLAHALQVLLELVRRPARACPIGLELDDQILQDYVTAPEAHNLPHEVDGRDDLGTVRDALAVEGRDHGAVVDPLAVALAQGAEDPLGVPSQELDGTLFAQPPGLAFSGHAVAVTAGTILPAVKQPFF